MDSAAVDKAKGRLRVAEKALADLRSSRTFSDFSDSWYVVLTSSKNVYTVLEEGAKTSPQSRQWFGAKKQVRRADPLLQYMFEARNDDEHGLGSSIEPIPELHEFGVAEPGFSNSVLLNEGPFSNVMVTGGVAFNGFSPPQNLRITPLDGKPVRVRRTPATTTLVAVTARGNRIIAPPTHHLGKPLTDTSPVAVADLNIAYLVSLLGEAERRA